MIISPPPIGRAAFETSGRAETIDFIAPSNEAVKLSIFLSSRPSSRRLFSILSILSATSLIFLIVS
jgi:hypothetical protein